MERNNEYETFHHRMVNAFESFLSLPPACPISFSLIQFSVSIYALNVIFFDRNFNKFLSEKIRILYNQKPIIYYVSFLENVLFAEPVTEIAGGPDIFINKDSTINLTCLVRYAPEPPSTIVWIHDHKVSWIFPGKISESFSNFLLICISFNPLHSNARLSQVPLGFEQR